ncbi:protein jagged-1b-like [Branchiostoma lanceolatum]|uniref:protein jagged-1b-like n=1 Tax=Branchiostoma lanceolatum TaxID=7740 RepID=UPI00345714C9
MAKMWKFLLLFAAAIVWPDSAQGQPVYLTTVDGFAFYKIVTAGAMTSANVKATCEAAGMGYPCYYSGSDGCTYHWTSGCITYDAAGVSCYTHDVLSANLCGTTDGHGGHCQPLDDTFVYCPGCFSFGGDRDSAFGVDYETHTYGLQGAYHTNMYALCADIDDCASSPCAHGTCTDGHMNYTCSCENGWTGTNCDHDIDECASNPCLLGGTCLDDVGGFSCVCTKDATGKICETG